MMAKVSKMQERLNARKNDEQYQEKKMARAKFVAFVQKVQAEYWEMLMKGNGPEEMMKIMTDGDHMRTGRIAKVAEWIYKEELMSIVEITDAVWEGSDDLMLAECVRMNLQEDLGLEVQPMKAQIYHNGKMETVTL
jgi:hypothetical protein